MDPAPSIELLGLLVSFLIIAFASAVEAALTAITCQHLSAQINNGEPRAQALMEFFDNPYHLRGTVLILTTIATVAATGLALALAQHFGLAPAEQALVLVGLSLLLLTLGIALPKTIATAYPDVVASRLAGPLRLAIFVCSPLLLVLRLLFSSTVRSTTNPIVSQEELRLLVNVGEEDGLIEPKEREMIKGIFEFSDTLVREVMVPRIDIVALPSTATVSQALDTLLKARHSRLPVYKESIDQIVGVLNIKDLLRLVRDDPQSSSIVPLLRPPFFVPETMKVHDLLHAMQQKRVRMAIIFDEYGGTSGLATIEDLVEEIVGEIQDEYDIEEPTIEQLAPGEWHFDGRILIHEVNELTGLQLESEEVDSLGGYVSEWLGCIPRKGDSLEVPGAMIIVESVKGLRPHQLRLMLVQSEAQPSGLIVREREHG